VRRRDFAVVELSLAGGKGCRAGLIEARRGRDEGGRPGRAPATETGGMDGGLPGQGLIELELGLWLGTGRIPGRGLIELGFVERWAACRGQRRWRWRYVEMAEDRPDGRRLGDKGDQAHRGGTMRAAERQALVDPRQ